MSGAWDGAADAGSSRMGLGVAGAETTVGGQIPTMERNDADLAGLIGTAEADLHPRFGAPESRRPAGGDLWLVYQVEPGRLRVRCAADAAGTPRVASWTITFREPRETLSSAARMVGLWPAAAPDAVAEDVETPLVRRSLRVSAARDMPCSLTATVRAGRFDRLSVFDEPPDWL